MTLKELEERIPYMKSCVYAQGKAIILYENERCEHITMSEELYTRLESKLMQDMKLRTKYRPEIKDIPVRRERSIPVYEKDLLIQLYYEGMSYRLIGEVFDIPQGTMGNIIARMIKSGELNKK